MQGNYLDRQEGASLLRPERLEMIGLSCTLMAAFKGPCITTELGVIISADSPPEKEEIPCVREMNF